MCKYFSVGLLLFVSLTLQAEKVSFSEQIRPLLNRNCTGCHGGVKQAGGFSLLYKESAFGKTNHGIGIVPGKPEESMLYKVITDPPVVFDKKKNKKRRLEHMPMEKDPLSNKEVALIKKWIEEGAHWEEHWAYNLFTQQDLPEKSSKWTQNRIDNFVLAKLKTKNLEPAPKAKKEILIRRVYLDLIGLPPSPEDVKRFINDKSPNAFEKVVDKLLASSSYGEKWAGMWLDLARYSDTQGYEKDNGRTIYRFRDEVIKGFNKDTPFDQFIIEQMAGDLLPNATLHQKILTAFHRNTMTNTEGGTNDEEFRVAAVIDRVNTTWDAFLGTSYGCVQCHTHPYDPFTHKEYFTFMSFLNNSADNDRNNEAPTIKTPDVYQQKQLDEWNKTLAGYKSQIETEKVKVLKDFNSHYTKLLSDLKAPEVKTLIVSKADTKSSYKLSHNKGGSLTSTKGKDKKATFTISGAVDLDKFNLVQLDAIKTQNGYGHTGNFVLSKIDVKVNRNNSQAGRYVRIEHAKPGILSLAEVQVFSNGKNIALKKPAKQSSTAYDGDAKRAVDGNTSGDYKKNTVTHTDGKDKPWWEVDLKKSSKIDEILLFNRNESPERLNNVKISVLDQNRKVVWSSKLGKASMKNQVALGVFSVELKSAVASFEQNGFPAKDALDKNKDKGWAVAGAKNQVESAWFGTAGDIKLQKGDVVEVTLSFESKHAHHVMENFSIKLGTGKAKNANFKLIGYKGKPADKLSKGDKEYIVNEIMKSGPAAKIYNQHASIEKKINDFRPATTPVMEELPADKKRVTKIFVGGDWENLGEQVSEGTPEILNEFKKEWPRNRLGMAYWMTSKENPLFARVAVNRFWEQLFGMGIVETLEDFGSQGIKPTHPKLLDDLAHSFANDLNWSVKKLLKTMVMSATYQQSSDVSKEKLAVDPFNHLLARGPRFRLSSEQIRDQGLKVSGLLSNKMFGPSVMPYQPDGVWMSVYNGRQWKTSAGEDKYRRGLYTYWKRTSPYPSMEAFDTPSREVCKVRRLRTNTPLQSLVTLNDPVFFEMAEAFGKKIKSYSGTLDEKMSFALQSALCRKPTEREIKHLNKLFNDIKRDFKKSEEETWTLVANVILNLDEFLTKR